MNPLVALKTTVLRRLGILELHDALRRISESQAGLTERLKRLEDTSKTDRRTLERLRESLGDCTASMEAVTEGLARLAPLLDDARSGLNTIVIGRLSERAPARSESRTSRPAKEDPER